MNEEALAIAKAIDQFASQTLVAAEQEERASELRYGLCTVIGYFTFAFGWLLALIGRLVGMDNSAEA